MEVTLDLNFVATVVALLMAFGAVVGYFWHSRSQLKRLIDMSDAIRKTTANATRVFEQVVSTNQQIVESLRRLEMALDVHEKENIAAHVQLLEALRRSKAA